jgi:transcription termination factor Rho
VTDTIDSTPAAGDAPKKRAGGLNSMLIADLKAMAGSMGIAGSGSMKKAQLVDAIKAAQGGGRPRSEPTSAPSAPRAEASSEPTREPRTESSTGGDTGPETRRETGTAQVTQRVRERGTQPARERGDRDAQGQAQDQNQDQGRDQNRDQGRDQNRDQGRDQNREQNRDQGRDRTEPANRDQGNQPNQPNRERNDQSGREQDGTGRNRRRRGRDRDRGGAQPNQATQGSGQPVQGHDRNQGGNRGPRHEIDTTILEDDVLVPAAGILDVLDNYAFVRTSGYLPGPDDVYVSLSMVRKYGLRRGDAIAGEVRQPREGERKEKFNPMVRIDSVNGVEPESAKSRVEFAKLTPLYPSERLRLETEPTNLIGRVIDIAAPIGKGQRGLIVSPSKAGKTMIMQSIANSITTNNPECHLMVVLVDERPEEVTDFERSVKGEVISSTFDRPASDHTTVAELAIERAKRLVELGHDVVVLLDGITRLGRAYNLSAPPSGRILSGGVDSAALYPPKKFFGAARNIENGGSLTILATALVESGSKMDEVIFEEFKGTGNMEIRLRRDFADKRIFPAIDAVQSGTRREELLMTKEELAVIWKLRRVLSGLDSQQALELLLERLKKSHNNMEFLMQVQKTTPAPGGED